MPREKEGRFWGETDAAYLSSGINEVKVWGMVERVLAGGLLWLGGIPKWKFVRDGFIGYVGS